MQDDALRKLIGDSFDLPPAPIVARRVLEIAGHEETSAKDMVDIVGPDAGITAQILKMANSSFYGLSHEISTLRAAVVTIGFNAVKDLVITASTRALYGDFDDNARALWNHAVGTGIVALLVARRSGKVPANEAFTAGLLHDVGRAVFITKERDAFLEVIAKLPCGGDDICDAEAEALGFSHGDVGAALMAQWQLPDSLVATVWLHHNLQAIGFSEDPPRALIAATSLADGIAHLAGIGSAKTDSLGKTATGVLPALGLTETDVDEIADKAAATYEKDAHLFL